MILWQNVQNLPKQSQENKLCVQSYKNIKKCLHLNWFCSIIVQVTAKICDEVGGCHGFVGFSTEYVRSLNRANRILNAKGE